jgi:hypothetical protein
MEAALPVGMIDSRRDLPHWVPDGVSVFVTWRLAGTLPNSRCVEVLRHDSAGKRFLANDRRLNRADFGPDWLRNAEVARMIVAALRYGEEQRGFYFLHAFVVMPNHVHVVWEPRVSMTNILRWIKGATARRAKGMLGLDIPHFLAE